ncbi:MAG: hypothetical protein ACFWUD_03125 [Thermocaproicibacter melissae]|jgi:hypothetical protein
MDDDCEKLSEEMEFDWLRRPRKLTTEEEQ